MSGRLLTDPNWWDWPRTRRRFIAAVAGRFFLMAAIFLGVRRLLRVSGEGLGASVVWALLFALVLGVVGPGIRSGLRRRRNSQGPGVGPGQTGQGR